IDEQCVDGLAAFEIDDADGFAGLQNMAPRQTRGVNDVETRGAWIAGGGCHGGAHWPICARKSHVLSNARSASSQEVLHRSSAVAGGLRQTITSSASPVAPAGASGWRVFESATRTFISARRSTNAPGLTTPSSQESSPLGPTSTPAKKFTQGTTS